MRKPPVVLWYYKRYALQIRMEDKTMKVNIGISEKQRKNIAEQLSRLLADTYLLY